MNAKVSAFQHLWKPCWQIPESILLPGIQTPPSWAPLVKSAGVAETGCIVAQTGPGDEGWRLSGREGPSGPRTCARGDTGVQPLTSSPS